MTHAAPASLLTIFGATGDLARRMLLPSLYSLQAEQLLPANLRSLGTARSELDRDGFANLVSASIAERIPAAERDDAALRGLLDRLDYAAAIIDMSTNYFLHTGTQSVARSLIARAANEV